MCCVLRTSTRELVLRSCEWYQAALFLDWHSRNLDLSLCTIKMTVLITENLTCCNVNLYSDRRNVFDRQQANLDNNQIL